MLNLHDPSKRFLAATTLALCLAIPVDAGEFTGLDASSATLHDMDVATGTASILGTVSGAPVFGFNFIERAPNGTLYALAPIGFSGYSIYTINELTLAATLVHSIYSGMDGSVGFTVDPSGNSVWVAGHVGFSTLVTVEEVNLVSGLPTHRGDTSGVYWGLAFDSAGDLFSARAGALQADLYKIDQVDAGNSTFVGFMFGVDITTGLDVCSAGSTGSIHAFSRNSSIVYRVDSLTGGSTPLNPLSGASAITTLTENPQIPPLDLCFGDGGDQLGCTNCPCSNNAPIGTIGGCLNSVNTSARLIASGNQSVSLPPGLSLDLRFSLTGAPPGAFCLLNSGDSVAPGNGANPCFGMASGAQAAAFDGLRCAILNTRRHGGRSADGLGDVGATNAPWGGEGGPPVGIAQARGGFVGGQTRYFQVIHRDDAMAGCMRGLNTSQAIQITFAP